MCYVCCTCVARVLYVCAVQFCSDLGTRGERPHTEARGHERILTASNDSGDAGSVRAV